MIRRWESGAVIADHPIGRDGAYEATFGAPYYGLHRVALLQALADRLSGEAVHLGRRCAGVEEHASGAELRFADGRSATADLVVGADGSIRSATPSTRSPAGHCTTWPRSRAGTPRARC